MFWSTILKTIVLLLSCSRCISIRVPILWDQDGSIDNTETSDSKNSEYKTSNEESEFQVETFQPQNVNLYSASVQKPIPAEYFQYTAQKPQFAVDVAAFHGVKNPEQYYRAYPVKPHTGLRKPVFGKHYMNEQDKLIFHPFQRYTAKTKSNNAPVLSNYEVFHPYKAEEPALKQLYKDPTLLKIRNDIRENKNRLQNYEIEAGEPNVSKEEYLQSSDDIDKDKFPIRNEPARYEIYKPQRRPIYYKPPYSFSRDKYLNKKFKHPLYQHYVKIRPSNYRPLKNYIHNLKQVHAEKYDDEHNEYPQVRPESYEEITDGSDIYEKGKEKYINLRNNVEDEVKKATLESRPESYTNLELQSGGESDDSTSLSPDDEEDEFVPIKNYAQVRRTETTKHLPREAALREASNYEEIENAPRLREAVKSTKSQTVYSEEGYEDTAYDHAGEQKHASDHEAHGGFLKENEKSKGKYKAPEVSGSYNDGFGSEYGDEVSQGKKWDNNEKDTQEQIDDEGSNQNDYDDSIEDDIYNSVPVPDESKNHEIKHLNIRDHDVNKREANFKIPELNFNNTFLTEEDIINIPINKEPIKPYYLKSKYPYYQKITEELSKHSPLRYAENLKRIPLKTRGGTEFYDSRSLFQCPEVDEELDPIPKNVKEAEKNQMNETQIQNNRNKRGAGEVVKEKPRLKGLGDKIDCFKAKYFGENPLDSPFFNEEIISNPEPIRIPNIVTYKLKELPPIQGQESNYNNVYTLAENLREQNKKDIFDLIEKIKNNSFSHHNKFEALHNDSNTNSVNKTIFPELVNNGTRTHQFGIYSDVIKNIRNIEMQKNNTDNSDIITTNLFVPALNLTNSNITYSAFNNKENITTTETILRKKRHATFVYEPYKVIRDNNQGLDFKKTTTLTNVSPLIKQLQSTSRVVEVVPNPNDKKMKDKLQPVKRNIRSKQYKDIGRKERSYNETKQEPYPSFTDVNADNRKVEPSYEITYSNHKNTYTPVENKMALTADDYTAIKQKKDNLYKKTENKELNTEQKVAHKTPISTKRPYFDVSQYLPKTFYLRNNAPFASKALLKEVHQIKTSPNKVDLKMESLDSADHHEGNKDYEEEEEEGEDEDEEEGEGEGEGEDEENYDEIISSTIKSPLRIIKSTTTTTTTQKPKEVEITTPQPKLKLVTRFRKPTQSDMGSEENEDKLTDPKYSEKSKKSTKSTLVTDTKKYGDEDDDMRKEEIDAMIGIKHDMDDYMPQYEKKDKQRTHLNPEEIEEDSSSSEEYDEYEDDEDDEDEDDEVSSEEIIEDDDNDDNGNTKQLDDDVDKSETRSENKLQPIVLKKKIEIHKELPENKSLPYTTQFKEDIVEEETIKKLPKKNLEALELYKDNSLAKKVNKLADVEIFKEDLRLKKSPKHGGNYRRNNEEEKQDSDSKDDEEVIVINDDADTSQSKNEKLVQFNDNTGSTDIKRTRPNSAQVRGRSRYESSRTPRPNEPEEPVENINLKPNIPKRIRGERQNSARLEIAKDTTQSSNKVDIPLFVRRRRIQAPKPSSKPEIDESEPTATALHGGNLRALAKKSSSRIKAADILNSFAQAVPILTTTPAYILDPSKRMYYYVDA